jgi:hypothetical protein
MAASVDVEKDGQPATEDEIAAWRRAGVFQIRQGLHGQRGFLQYGFASTAEPESTFCPQAGPQGSLRSSSKAWAPSSWHGYSCSLRNAVPTDERCGDELQELRRSAE